MKILLFLLLLLTHLFSNPKTEIVLNSWSWFKNLEPYLFNFATTYSTNQTGPDITKLIKKNRKFFVKLTEKRLKLGVIPETKYLWWSFEDNVDSNKLQMMCYDYKATFYDKVHQGYIESAEWFFVDLIPSDSKDSIAETDSKI